MSLSRQIASQIYYGIGSIIEKIASFFGYPENPGMPISSRFSELEQIRYEKLSMHQVQFPPEPVPDNLVEVLVGVIPKPDPIKRFFYETPSEGYYNFYIQDFKNAYFLPNWLSEIIQVWFKVCLDISGLEAIREVIFISLLTYYNILNLRLCMFWFLSINPYTYPWLFLVYLVDWTEDILQGLVPVVAGVNLTATFWFVLIGKFADSLNHLVFTMPFLPSEGQRAQTIINGQIENIVLFRFFPILWFKNDIPNDVREFWYYNRPDILKFMQKSYGHLDKKLLPDSKIESMTEKEKMDTHIEIKSNLLKQQLESSSLEERAQILSEPEIKNVEYYPNEEGTTVINSPKIDIDHISNYFQGEDNGVNHDGGIEHRLNFSEFGQHISNSIQSYEPDFLNLSKNFNIDFNKTILEHFDIQKSIFEQFIIDEHIKKIDNNITDNLSTHIFLNNKLIYIDEFNNYLTQFFLSHFEKGI